MNLTRHHHRSLLALLALLAFHGVCLGQDPAEIEDTGEIEDTQTAPAQPDDARRAADDKELRFSFEGAPWRDVIKWLADESNLALHVGDLPTGSFTYSDPNSFTSQQAIDRVNLFLLPQGFTLVRNDNLLSLINLGDSRSTQQLDALARLITVDQLDKLPTHDVVKCIFPLGKLKAEDAVEELSPLNLMTNPSVFERTNRLMIIDSVGKLRSAKAILDAFQPSTMADGTAVQNFALKHANAEDILVVLRPHLGLATGEMIGIDVSLSADPQGKNIFVTGVEDKLKLIEGLVQALDKPDESLSTTDGKNELRSHLVPGGNVETVYNVLQTLLAGKSVRLSMDEAGDSIVALATPEIQQEIAATVAQLQASEADFEVIPLKSADPYQVVSLLEQLLDLPDEFDDPDEIDPDAPKVDADPGNMRLFVRGKKHQIEQIKKIVAGLDSDASSTSDQDIRLLPVRGKQADRLVRTAARFWNANPIVLFPPAVEEEPQTSERTLNGEAQEQPTEVPAVVRRSPEYLTDNLRSKSPPIRCQVTERGLLLQSDDIPALEQFYEHLRAIAGPLDSLPSRPVVFYLKYTKPNDAIRMLAELLDGGDNALEGEAGSLVSGFVGSAGSLLGSLVTSREGTTSMSSGTLTVVADSRLNRLIAQGTAADIERIESYLKIVDKDNSITSIETYGTSHVIELKHTRATEVAASLREAFAGRIVAGNTSGQQAQRNQQGGGQPQQNQRDPREARGEGGEKNNNENRGGNERRAPDRRQGQPARNLEPRMTIAVHEPSNSLIITAPEPLFREAEQLALLIDSRSEETVEVLTIQNAAGRELLNQFLSGSGASARTGSRTSSRPTSPQRSGTPQRSPNPATSNRGGR